MLVTHRRILNRVHTDLKPNKSASTRSDPVPPAKTRIVARVNSWGFRGLQYGGHVENFSKFPNRLEIRFKSFSTPINPDVKPCHNPLHEGQWGIRQGSMWFYIAGQCG
jgi:hypothetical protein